MKRYLEVNRLPTVKIGRVELPRLIMGIHPYDGCSYVSAERDRQNLDLFDQAGKVSKVLRYAVEEHGLKVVQGDKMNHVINRLQFQAIWENEQQTKTQIGLVVYIMV